MKDNDKYAMSFFGGFVDKDLEMEFLHYDINYSSRLTGNMALIFGAIYMSFIISDYFVIKSLSLFMTISFIRVVFFILSIIIYFRVKKINSYFSIIRITTAYEIVFFISFIVLVFEYGPNGLIPFFSIMAITWGIYIMPNKLINTQIISVFFNLFFLIIYTNCIEYIETDVLLKAVKYCIIFIIFGNMKAYMSNFYRRKQFANSKRLLRLSATDPLTGIYNRGKFDQELNWWTEYCNMYGKPLSLIIFDIDDFKKINDNYGHLVGDSVLKTTTSIIKDELRSTDIFARWGGDEFVILFPDTAINDTLRITERIRVCILKNKYDRIDNITCSFGLVSLQKNENTQSMLQRADKFLYKAKSQGKNTIAAETGSKSVAK
ncbi:MAG: GGDEF domain-containing protein [Clostridium sp.]|jgi:diguanylate cyclase (GGDEF)-like protein|uniref:GGDEF domain-containing protein n=1 Tax=Clostridium sp. TaxID=1506 RepID=UPI0025C55A07|nr:GGDEF domain-containing protein [Clostridium sp.]MCH3964667.1 GGDEF domain-containing protein [Clostridium sp.]MCI1715138.1 GGDEF domain-containing protein [Clostridium sp.]MCI1799400.1 GGDEF domain-containing protein [Clostridium sp.]MCI1813321.1 GGDEF domain-containing protein [Clostridium sp.]MCI1870212.1 GGDEF domain-containing protein [Clostridium sp.]